MSELKLKKCPFCGGPAEIVDNSRYDPGTYFVGCLYCGARSDYEHGEENAAELWNGRVSQMITDEERREAIENLRCLSYMNRVRYKEEFYELLDETVMEPDTGYHEMNDVFERIADLIDRPTTTRHGKFKTKYGRETPCCEVCGYSIGDMRWNHCPKCGAAIVDD